MEPTTVFCVSYVPLLYPSGNEKISEDIEKITKIIEPYLSMNHLVHACLWAKDTASGDITPVFLMDNADEYRQHIIDWSEKDSSKWFNLYINERDDFYYVMLFPNLLESKDRYKYRYYIETMEKLSEDTQFTFLFQPLIFRSQNPGTYRTIKHSLPNKCKLGFLEASKFDRSTNTSTEEPKYVGPFDVNKNCEFIQPYIESYFKND